MKENHRISCNTIHYSYQSALIFSINLSFISQALTFIFLNAQEDIVCVD